jgi:hypothetical protein
MNLRPVPYRFRRDLAQSYHGSNAILLTLSVTRAGTFIILSASLNLYNVAKVERARSFLYCQLLLSNTTTAARVRSFLCCHLFQIYTTLPKEQEQALLYTVIFFKVIQCYERSKSLLYLTFPNRTNKLLSLSLHYVTLRVRFVII